MAPLPPSLSYPESLRGSVLSLLKKALGIEAKSVSSSASRTQLPSGFLTLKHSKMLGYGTTDKHPEQGEECFAVSMDKRGAVRGYVYAVSKPKRLIGYLGVPAQHLAAKLYLQGM